MTTPANITPAVTVRRAVMNMLRAKTPATIDKHAATIAAALAADSITADKVRAALDTIDPDDSASVNAWHIARALDYSDLNAMCRAAETLARCKAAAQQTATTQQESDPQPAPVQEDAPALTPAVASAVKSARAAIARMHEGRPCNARSHAARARDMARRATESARTDADRAAAEQTTQDARAAWSDMENMERKDAAADAARDAAAASVIATPSRIHSSFLRSAAASAFLSLSI